MESLAQIEAPKRSKQEQILKLAQKLAQGFTVICRSEKVFPQRRVFYLPRGSVAA